MQRRADQQRRARQWSVVAIIVVLVVGVGLGAAAIAGALPGQSSAAANSTKSPAVTTSPTTSASPSASPSPSVTAALVNGRCVYTKSGTASRKVSRPPAKPDRSANYTATIKTNRGNIVIDLLNSKAPCTVNSFVSLADQKFYNSTPCHRLTTAEIYVLQCGDPTGTGSGGPGYQFYTENLTGGFLAHVNKSGEATYPAGSVAMARETDPDTNGSQFFLVYKNSPLPPSYTPFGTIVSGLNIIQNVAKAGSDNSNGAGDGHPKEKVEIDSVTIKKT